MRDAHHIPALIEVYAAARDLSPHTVGRLASGDGTFYRRLRDGRDITCSPRERG